MQELPLTEMVQTLGKEHQTVLEDQVTPLEMLVTEEVTAIQQVTVVQMDQDQFQ